MDEKTLHTLYRSTDSIDPNEFLIFRIRIQIEGSLDAHVLCAEMAMNGAWGTTSRLPWTDSSMPYVLELSEVGDKYRVDVAYPKALFGSTFNLPQILTIAGLPAEYGDTRFIWTDDIQFPRTMLDSINGPKFGAAGILTWRHTADQPLLSAILKPRLGGDLQALKTAVRGAISGGVDGIVDDEGLVDPHGTMSFRRRVPELAELLHSAGAQNSRTYYYVVNATAPISLSLELAQIAADAGARGVILNPFAMGYGAFEYVSTACAELGLAVIDCSIGSALLCLPTAQSGISLSLLSKFARLLGADGSHSGSEGEHWYTPSTLRRVIASIEAPLGHIKPTLPIIAGSINVGNVWRKTARFGANCMINAGTGIWTHPSGPEKGAHAIRRVLQEMPRHTNESAHAAMRSLYSKDKAVKDGIDKWDYRPIIDAPSGSSASNPSRL